MLQPFGKSDMYIVHNAEKILITAYIAKYNLPQKWPFSHILSHRQLISKGSALLVLYYIG